MFHKPESFMCLLFFNGAWVVRTSTSTGNHLQSSHQVDLRSGPRCRTKKSPLRWVAARAARGPQCLWRPAANCFFLRPKMEIFWVKVVNKIDIFCGGFWWCLHVFARSVCVFLSKMSEWEAVECYFWEGRRIGRRSTCNYMHIDGLGNLLKWLWVRNPHTGVVEICFNMLGRP